MLGLETEFIRTTEQNKVKYAPLTLLAGVMHSSVVLSNYILG